jgi:hypothetical protein
VAGALCAVTLRLVTTHVVELSLEAFLGPSDDGVDLRSDGRVIGYCGSLRRAPTGATFLDGRIEAVKLGCLDMPLA